jgi:TolB-like protein/tetratricopeptide (TPR) repeat protein
LQYLFETYLLDTDRRELRRASALVSIEPQVFDLLEFLVRNRERVVTKDDLIDSVWHGRIVSESTLSTRINAARSAIDDSGEQQRLIKTLARKGIRFVGEVREVRAQTAAGTTAAVAGRVPDTAGSWDEAPALTLPDKPSIAVLPFTNMSGDPEQEYFADGMVEEITTALARFPVLFVIARNSSFTYKGRTADIKQVGRDLGVRYVLEGSVRKAGNRVRMTGQLIQAETGMHVWAERYERDLGDIFALQDEMTTSIVGALVPSIQKAEIERIRHKPPGSLDAYDLYLRGLAAYFTWTRDGHSRALELAEQALRIDASLVPAMLLAGNCWALRIGNGWWSPLQEAIGRLTHYARLAVQIDPDNAEALAILARRTPAITRDHAEAIVLATRAVSVNPNSAYAWRNTGHALVTCGVPEEAVTHFGRALRLDPRDPNGHDTVHGMALALIQLGRDAEAVTFARRAVQQNPNIAPSWRTLASALAMSGQLDEARAALRQMLVLDPACTVQTMARRVGYSETTGARIFAGWRKAGMPE